MDSSLSLVEICSKFSLIHESTFTSILFPNSQKTLYLLFSKSCLLFPPYAQIDEMNIKLFMNVKQKNS